MKLPRWSLLVAAVAVAYVVIPIAALLGEISWSDFASQVTSSQSLTALRLSLTTSVLAVLVVVVLGIPLAWVLGRMKFRGRGALRALIILPMVLPPVVAGVALLSAFSRESIIGGWLYDWFGVQLTFSTAGVVLAQSFVSLPFFVVAFEGSLRALNPAPEEVASSLGASSWTVFRRITFPSVAPAFLAAVALAWARALGEFGATITFAGNVAGRTQTAPLAIFLNLGTDPGAALAMSAVLLAISAAILVGLRDRWLIGR